MQKSFILLKEMRLQRTIIPILASITPLALTTTLNIYPIISILSCILIYAAASIHNAYIDNDFLVKKKTRRISILFVIFALIISAFNPITFLVSLLWISLGLLYNTVSRRILFADTIILSITHILLPYFSTVYLLNIIEINSIGLGIILTTIFLLLSQTKNLKGHKDDKKRNYKTPMTVFRNGNFIINIFFLFSISLMISVYYSLGFQKLFLLSSTIILFLVMFSYCFKEEKMLKIMRFIFLFFVMSIITHFSSSIIPIMMSIIFCFLYALPILQKEVKIYEPNLRHKN
ncbi:MAG: UbiA family prenyltransferase [Bacteroidota bacterium]